VDTDDDSEFGGIVSQGSNAGDAIGNAREYGSGEDPGIGTFRGPQSEGVEANADNKEDDDLDVADP
jgi:hypothetical protein